MNHQRPTYSYEADFNVGDDHSMLQLQNRQRMMTRPFSSPPVSPSSQVRDSFAVVPPNNTQDDDNDDLLLGLSRHYYDIPTVIYICKQEDTTTTKASSSSNNNKLRIVKVRDIEEDTTKRTRKSTGTESTLESQNNIIPGRISRSSSLPPQDHPMIVTQKWGNTYFF